jgi:hypothetical protein
MHIEEMTGAQIIAVVRTREDGYSSIPVRDIAEELQRRSKTDNDVHVVVNDRFSSNCVVCAGRNEPLIVPGENMAIVVNGLFDV